jgi:biotin carboxyl carrier protein
MPGLVVSVNCQPGSMVSAGDVLIVIESMKMQINITAPRDGEVENVHAETNSAFQKNAELISLKAQE